MDVWSQHFRDIPCAVTPVPAKDYGNTEGMIEINLIALKDGARATQTNGRDRHTSRRRLLGPACGRANLYSRRG